MLQSDELVSVVMPVFNGERHVAPAVASVLAQSHRNLELIVIDDGSTDGTVAAVASVADDRVRVISQPNSGEAAARNTGLAAARGAFIAWQDADDLSVPSRISAQLRAVLSTGAGFAHCDMLLIDAADAPLGYWQSSAVPRSRVLPFLLRAGTPYNNPTMLLRKDAICGLEHDTSLRIGTDTDFVRQFAPRVDGVHVPEPLVLYRRHAASATSAVTLDDCLPQVQRLINGHPLDDLVPEARIAFPDAQEAEAVARAVIARHLARLGHVAEAIRWFEEVERAGTTGDAVRVVSALVALASNDPARVLATLPSCVQPSGISLSLLGEAAGRLGDWQSAADYYRRSLAMNPDSFDAIAGLRATGGAAGLNLVDATWRSFAS